MFGDSCIHAETTRAFSATGSASHDLPTWVADAVAAGASLRTAVVAIDHLSGPSLQKASEGAFGDALNALPGPPNRVWCFTPRITDPDQDGLNRYMRMNMGRSSAYTGLIDPTSPPAGTGVGHAGRDLVVHALHVPGSSRTIENPRQCPAWRYSSRFGPCPPPFARATSVGPWVFASGTASVVGESSMHDGDPIAQWYETMLNLAALADAAAVPGVWSSLSAYVSTGRVLEQLVAGLPPGSLDVLERAVVAPLCRAELLVEIEGVWHG